MPRFFFKNHRTRLQRKGPLPRLRARAVVSTVLVSLMVSCLPWSCQADVTERGFQVGLSDAITPEVVQGLKQDWGINLARIQVGDNGRMDGAVGQEYLDMMEGAFALVDSKLPLFAQNNIKVVFTLYSPPGGFLTRQKVPHHAMFSDQGLQQDFIRIWETIIDRYGNNPAIYAFDLSNEPAEDRKSVCATCKTWAQLVPDVVAAIRAKNSSVRLIIKPPYANSSKLGQMPILDDPLIIYNYHAYPFIRYQHAGLDGISSTIARPTTQAVQQATYGRLRAFLAKWTAAHKEGRVKSPVPTINVGEVTVSSCAAEAGVFLNDMLGAIEGNFDAIDGTALKLSCNSIKKKNERAKCNKRAKALMRKYPLVPAMRKAHTSWTHHGFNDATVWDPRYACSPTNEFFVSPTETDRETVLRAYFSRNTH